MIPFCGSWSACCSGRGAGGFITQLVPGRRKKGQKKFEDIMEIVEGALSQTPGGYFLEEFSTADCVFLPYVERMAASCFTTRAMF